MLLLIASYRLVSLKRTRITHEHQRSFEVRQKQL